MENKHLKKSIISYKLFAEERTLLANERNTLAYIRTGFSAFLLGIGLLKLFEGEIILTLGGWGAIFLGLIFILLGLAYYPIRKKRIKSHQSI